MVVVVLVVAFLLSFWHLVVCGNRDNFTRRQGRKGMGLGNSVSRLPPWSLFTPGAMVPDPKTQKIGAKEVECTSYGCYAVILLGVISKGDLSFRSENDVWV